MISKLFRGSLDTIILELLNRNGEMYGYEISQKIKELSNGEFQITEGAMYPALHKLQKLGYLKADIRNISNRMRKYYRLTNKGTKETAKQVSAMKEYISNLDLIFNPQVI